MIESYIDLNIQKLYVTIFLKAYTSIKMQTESSCNSPLLLSVKMD